MISNLIWSKIYSVLTVFSHPLMCRIALEASTLFVHVADVLPVTCDM